MDKLLVILKRKPLLFLFISLGYLVLVGFIKWQLHPPVSALWFLLGGAAGVYFLDAAEVFFALNPSPFRSIVFVAAFIVLSFFIVSSSGSLLASGLVLSLYLSILLWQLGEWQYRGNLNDWYRMVATPIAVQSQVWILAACMGLFAVQTVIFIRW